MIYSYSRMHDQFIPPHLEQMVALLIFVVVSLWVFVPLVFAAVLVVEQDVDVALLLTVFLIQTKIVV